MITIRRKEIRTQLNNLKMWSFEEIRAAKGGWISNRAGKRALEITLKAHLMINTLL